MANSLEDLILHRYGFCLDWLDQTRFIQIEVSAGSAEEAQNDRMLTPELLQILTEGISIVNVLL